MPVTFVSFCKNKIAAIVNESAINLNVYNGRFKLFVYNKNFTNERDVFDAIKSLKLKSSEGLDWISTRFLVDGSPSFLEPLRVSLSIQTELWNQTISRTLVILQNCTHVQKNENHKIENYRPIANLCSTSKIFKKLILQRFMQI